MELINVTVPFFLHTIENHYEIKKDILLSINSMGINPLIDDGQRISNTDWSLPGGHYRPYFKFIEKPFENLVLEIQNKMGGGKLQIVNYWFQQYSPGDFHQWHHHGEASISSVYYVDLPEGAAKTTFNTSGEEFEIEVKEGQVLSFYGFCNHISKPTKNNKTVIAFNSDFII